MKNNPGIIVLLTRHHIGSLVFINNLIKQGINIKAIVQSDTIFSRNNNLLNFIKRLRIMGISLFIQITLIFIYMQIGLNISNFLSFFGINQKFLTLKQICKRDEIPLIRTTDINSDKTYNEIKSIEPDIIVSCYFNQILKNRIFNIPKVSTVNVHSSLTQKYRGLNNYFWVLVNNERESGVTIHEIDEGIDTGKIIAQRTVKINNTDTAMAIFVRLSQECAELFLNSMEKIINKQSTINDTSQSKYYSLPTKEAYWKFLETGRKLYHFSDFSTLF
ncbi:MAG: methionyl-tRNA formyltransferase [Candidatus Dadabacteria bacterium]|jgi:folate-dependent phosphoribosylglycinamide formyltransferase PurN